MQRNNQIIVGSVLLALIVGAIFLTLHGSGGGDTGKTELKGDQLTFVQGIESTGSAIAMQALLSEHGIRVDRTSLDNKSALMFEKGATEEDRDNALMVLVKSGMLDNNVGLEMFDKGDLTASSEDKRIRLIQAQQGELARLIKRFSVVQDASVVITIPQNSVFKTEQKPLSVSVQVKTVTGDRLPHDVVRSIINLVVASLQNVTPDRVALTDTNGNVYNSVLNTTSEMQDRIEDEDQYMKQKVSAQLDKLVGQNKYVVTVSTYLRENTKETMTQTYNPEQSAVSTKQSFSENLNSTNGSTSAGGAASSLLPGSMATTSVSNGGGKGYNRTGTEISYNNAQMQSLETSMPGVIEDISVAATIDRNSFKGSGINTDDLRALIAHAASPKVNPDNVSVLTADFNESGHGVPLTSASDDGPKKDPFSWVPWAIGSTAALILLMVVLSLAGGKKDNSVVEETQREIQELRELTMQQQAQLTATQRQTQQMMETQNRQAIPQQSGAVTVAPGSDISQLKRTLEEVKEAVRTQPGADDDDDDLDTQIKSWIESS